MNDNVARGTGGTSVASVLNMIAGLWLIISPFILGFTTRAAAMWVAVVVGIIVMLLACIRAANPQRHIGLSWLNLLLGLWLIVAPFVLGFAAATPTWNSVILGIIVALLAIGGASSVPAMTRPMP